MFEVAIHRYLSGSKPYLLRQNELNPQSGIVAVILPGITADAMIRGITEMCQEVFRPIQRSADDSGSKEDVQRTYAGSLAIGRISCQQGRHGPGPWQVRVGST